MPNVPLRLCIDRVLPLSLQPRAAELAVQRNPRNRPPKGRQRRPGQVSQALPIAFLTTRLWKTGDTLRIAFLDGSDTQQDRVMDHAAAWLDHANLTFDFTASVDEAEIRISFGADEGSWSAVGTDCLVTEAFPKGQPTMNFGWLRDDTDEAEYRRVVLHEFGHAMGAIHEHQNPTGGLRWNLSAVYRYFSGPPNNWSERDILTNVVQKYERDQLNGTEFDPKSIMLYSFPRELVSNTNVTQQNDELSENDKAFAASVYPPA